MDWQCCPKTGSRRCCTRRRRPGGLGSSLNRLIEATQAIAHDVRGSLEDIDDIIERSAPIIDSQVNSGNEIARWAANLNTLAAQTAQTDPAVRSILANAAPTADQVNATFSDVRESLPQTLANLEVVIDMLKRYHNGVEQALVFLPQSGAIAQSVTTEFPARPDWVSAAWRSTNHRRA